MSSAATQATATGTLGNTPLLNLLVYMLDREMTGSLVIEDHRYRKSAVLFEKGVPTKAKTADPVIHLGELLVEKGTIDSETMNRTLGEASKQKVLHGKALLDAGALDEEALETGLAEQIARKVLWLATLRPESVYGYYDGQNFLARWGGSSAQQVRALEIVWRAVKGHSDQAAIRKTLSRFGDRPLKLHPQSRVNLFGFSGRERGVVDVLRAKPLTLDKLSATGLLPPADLEQLLYGLTITRHLDLGDEHSAPIGVKVVASMTAPAVNAKRTDPARRVSTKMQRVRPDDGSGRSSGLTPEQVEELRKEIMERYADIGGQNYYEILGVDEKAPGAAIQGAFFKLAKRWHPDKLDPAAADLREQVQHIFSRMTEAHQILSSDEKRKEYAELMKDGGATADEQEKVQKVLRAASAFQRADLFFKQGKLGEAEKHAKEAYEDDPEQAEYVALYADIVSQKTETKDFTEVVKLVNDARKMQPDNIRVRLYRARVLKRAGEHKAAKKEFRYVAEEDRRNVEAQRELRLYEMRGGKGASVPPAKRQSDSKDLLNKDIGSIFGKFFKR